MTEPQALSKAQNLHQLGRISDALAILLPIVSRGSDNVQLLMAAGLMARDISRFDVALDCFSKAQSRNASDPQIANIYANTLSADGQNDKALFQFEKILGKFPDLVDAHINRAITAQKIDEKHALTLINESLRTFPENARMWSVKGTILKNLDQIDDAVKAFDQALRLEPGRAVTLFNRGVTLRAGERHDEALAVYEELERLGTRGPQIDSAKAAVLLELDQVEAAEVLYKRAFAAGDGEAGQALVRLRHEYLLHEDPFEHLGNRARSNPGEFAWWDTYLTAILAFGEYERLLSAANEAATQHADNSKIAYFRALGEAWAGNREIALDILEKLVHLSPKDHSLNLTLAEIRLACNDPDGAEYYAAKVIESEPFSQAAWAYRSTAWRLLDHPRKNWLCNYDTLVTTHNIDVQTADTNDYVSSLANSLKRLHKTHTAPGNQSLRQGTQTSGSLFNRSDEFLASFRERLTHILDSKIRNLPQDPEHPFLARASRNFRFRGSWSVRLNGDGHHIAHFHDQGWISSVYYAELPDSIGTESNRAGWLQFGVPPERLELDLASELSIQPKVGMVVLFPSYLWHGTIPFPGEQTRLTAAFDVIPD